MNEFTKLLKKKGWNATDIAQRWGITTVTVSRIGRDPKQIHWDALNGLPDPNALKDMVSKSRISRCRSLL